MDVIDLKLKLLAGDPIDAEGYGEIKPLSLREIKGMGFIKYNQHLGLVLTNLKETDIYQQLKEEFQLPDDVDLTIMDIAIATDEIRESFVDALKFLLHAEEVRVDIDNMCLIVDEKFVLYNGNLDKVQDILSLQNCLKQPDDFKDSTPNPKDSHAQRVLEKLKKGKSEVSKYKGKSVDPLEQKEETEMDIADIISAVSTRSNHYNKNTVWDLTLYQLYDEFARIRMIEEYDISIQSMMQGAKDVSLKHWARRIVSEN